MLADVGILVRLRGLESCTLIHGRLGIIIV